MSSVVLTGDTSGSGTITVPAVAGTFTATIGSATGTHYPFTAGTAVASTSGTSINFTGIPSWVKRITVMFSGVSTNGSSKVQLQLGSGSVQTSGYAGNCSNNVTNTVFSSAFVLSENTSASNLRQGTAVLTLLSTNIWVESGNIVISDGSANITASAGSVALSGTLDRVRITTVNGTDTFDAGSINILYE